MVGGQAEAARMQRDNILKVDRVILCPLYEVDIMHDT